MSKTKVRQFTQKQIEIAGKLVEGYSYRDIENEGIASKRYVDELRTKPESKVGQTFRVVIEDD